MTIERLFSFLKAAASWMAEIDTGGSQQEPETLPACSLGPQLTAPVPLATLSQPPSTFLMALLPGKESG